MISWRDGLLNTRPPSLPALTCFVHDLNTLETYEWIEYIMPWLKHI